jgi:hypothetical protein
MAGIAISYRREDTGWITGRIFDRLKDYYEKPGRPGFQEKSIVFMDYDSTPIGIDFRNYIKDVLDNCDILLAVIGPHWAGDDEHGRSRIMQDGDWVRIEIEIALKKNIPVVPVLIDRTSLPPAGALPEGIRDLIYRQAATVNTQIDFNSHIERLIREIDRLTGLKSKNTAAIQPNSIARVTQLWQLLGPKTAYALTLISLCALASALSLIFFSSRRNIEPAYAVYTSPELGVTVAFPHNILTLDNTERMQKKLTLRDGQGQPLIKVLRTPLTERNPKVGRQNEISELTKMGFVLTYIAPEKEENWTNWYVLSGVIHGPEFYFRRWYCEDSVVSMEFMYPKSLLPCLTR